MAIFIAILCQWTCTGTSTLVPVLHCVAMPWNATIPYSYRYWVLGIDDTRIAIAATGIEIPVLQSAILVLQYRYTVLGTGSTGTRAHRDTCPRVLLYR